MAWPDSSCSPSLHSWLGCLLVIAPKSWTCNPGFYLSSDGTLSCDYPMFPVIFGDNSQWNSSCTAAACSAIAAAAAHEAQPPTGSSTWGRCSYAQDNRLGFNYLSESRACWAALAHSQAVIGIPERWSSCSFGPTFWRLAASSCCFLFWKRWFWYGRRG